MNLTIAEKKLPIKFISIKFIFIKFKNSCKLIIIVIKNMNFFLVNDMYIINFDAICQFFVCFVFLCLIIQRKSANSIFVSFLFQVRAQRFDYDTTFKSREFRPVRTEIEFKWVSMWAICFLKMYH